MKKHLIFFLALTFVAVFSAPAFAQYEVKDSFYFMKDDGEFSAEEKDEEAEYIYQKCEKNSIQRVYFDCACLAGAFRVARDKEKLVPQSTIVNSILTRDSRGCANTVAIAGDAYEFCTEYARVFRSRRKNNENFCGCVANKMALDFKKTPVLRKRKIEKMRTKALVSCGKEH